MSEPNEDTPDDDDSEAPPKLRRRLLGYKPADVQRVLEDRDGAVENLEGELGEREAELRELRQDVAALWLAFAQHDRMLRSLGDTQAAPPFASEPPAASEPKPENERETAPEPASGGDPAHAAEAPPIVESEARAEATDEEPSVGRQLADLDEVLAAIEMATQTLEQTYVEEIAETEDEEKAEAEPESGPESERSGGD